MQINSAYQYATHISQDCNRIAKAVLPQLNNRLEDRIKKKGELGKGYIRDRYGGSKQLRYVDGKPLCPIGYVQTRHPMYKKKSVCKYTPEGREEIHQKLRLNMDILWGLMRTSEYSEKC